MQEKEARAHAEAARLACEAPQPNNDVRRGVDSSDSSHGPRESAETDRARLSKKTPSSISLSSMLADERKASGALDVQGSAVSPSQKAREKEKERSEAADSARRHLAGSHGAPLTAGTLTRRRRNSGARSDGHPADAPGSPSSASLFSSPKVVSTNEQWRFIKKLISTGTLSYICCMILCRVTLETSEGMAVREAFYSQIPRLLYSLPVAAFGCAVFLNMSSWMFEAHRSRQQLCVLVIYISGIAFLYELLALYGDAPIFLTASGRPHSVMRYVMWSHTTPAMVYALSMLSDLTSKRVHMAMVADVVMILAAIPGEYCASWILRYFFNTLSFVLFPFVLREIYIMFTQAMDATSPNDRQAYTSLKFLRLFTIVLWSVFPVVWTLCQLQWIDSVLEEGLHSVADVFGKIVFSSSLLQSNFVSIDARRRLALQAAEDANRTAVIYELQELLAQKEEFITVITHELRTPLNGIIGLSEALLAAGALQGSNARSLGAIRNSGMRLLALVNDVLDAAAMKRGTLTVQRKKVNLSKLIDDVIELTEALLSPGVRLVTRVSAMTPLVIGDPQRLVQVMYNLVGNACKFTDEGEIVIECNGTVDDDVVVVTVKDTGAGIPEDKLADIFVPFSRGNMSECLRHGGTGLGLSVVKHIIEAHGGTIKVDSTVGVGSCFTFTIPCMNEENASRTSIESCESDKSSEMWKRFSMDSEARKSFEFEKKLLKKAGQQIDPREALAVFTSSKPNLPGWEAESKDANAEREHTASGTPGPLKPSDTILRDVKDNLKTYRVLSVDDDPVNQMVVQAMLKNKGGFEVMTAADGEYALSLIEELHTTQRLPDAILLDVMMPGLTGFEVVKRIRSTYPHWNVPVILVSAAGQKERIQEGIESGANAFIMKPLKDAELSKIILHYITKHAMS
jgi:signal transduction histidine kinase